MVAAYEQDGRSWAVVKEESMMDLLAFLGRCGYQDADSLARNRTVAWVTKLAARVEHLLEIESKAIRDANAKNRGG